MGLIEKRVGSPIKATKPLHGAIFTKHINGQEHVTLTAPTTAAYRHAHVLSWAQHIDKLRGLHISPNAATRAYIRVCAAINGLPIPEATRAELYTYYGKL